MTMQAPTRKRARFDIEADGLLDTITKVHVLKVRIKGEGVMHTFTKHNMAAGLRLLDRCDEIVAHNGVAFDLMALWLVYKWKPKAQVVDTFLDCQLLYPDDQGYNSLASWGEKLGEPKVDYKEAYKEWAADNHVHSDDPDVPMSPYRYAEGDEWKEYNEVMDRYCEQDVVVLEKLDDFLSEQIATTTTVNDKGETVPVDWSRARSMELQFAKDFARQGWRGVYVDQEHTRALLASIDAEMERIRLIVEPLLPPKPANQGELYDLTPKGKFKKDGKPNSHMEKWWDELEYKDNKWWGKKLDRWYPLPRAEPISETVPATLAHQEHIKTWLMECGWRPTMWSFKKAKDKNGKMRFVRGDDGNLIPTQPKFHEKGELCPNLENINSDFEHVGLVVRWIIYRHRRGLVASILDALRSDGCVSATGFSLGTPTSRVTHSVVANIPKAEPEVVLGKECRGMFCARPGRVFVGVDAAGLELCMLAHYVGSPELIEMVTKGKKEDGTDIHSVLWRACNPLVPSRTIQKNVTYGWLYGASDKKLGTTAGHSDAKAERVGARIRESMVKAIPGLDKFMLRVKAAAKRGSIIAIDGRRIELRSAHSALNTILQSAGSIVVKSATCKANQTIRAQRLDTYQVIHMHDEVQYDSHPAHAERTGLAFIEGLKWAGRYYNINCPLDGEVKMGRTWADTH